MNKKLFIIIGITLVVIVVGVWVYLILTGKSSQSDGVFAEFEEGGSASGNVLDRDPFLDDFDTSAIAKSRLRQLSLRPVANAVFVDSGIVFAEQGTGHIYHINLESGNETLVSGTTFPGARSAFFSKTGLYVVVVSTAGQAVVGSIAESGTLEGVSLPSGAEEIAFGEEESTLYYLLKTPTGSRGYKYNIDAAKTTELFDIPLGDIRVIWGDDIYIYTTPSSEQVGYVYEVVGDSLRYVTPGSNGLLVLKTNKGLVVTKTHKLSISAKFIEENDGVLFGALIPEKCVSSDIKTVCAIPKEISARTFPDSWYKGVESYSDILWDISIENGTSQVLSNLLSESGREIDVIKIGTNPTGQKFFLVNKNDNSLWLFDQTVE